MFSTRVTDGTLPHLTANVLHARRLPA